MFGEKGRFKEGSWKELSQERKNTGKENANEETKIEKGRKIRKGRKGRKKAGTRRRLRDKMKDRKARAEANNNNKRK